MKSEESRWNGMVLGGRGGWGWGVRPGLLLLLLLPARSAESWLIPDQLNSR